MITLSILVRVCIWIISFYKLEVLKALMGSHEFCSLDLQLSYYAFVFVCLMQSLSYILWMFNDFLLGMHPSPPPPSTVTCFKVRYSVYQIALPFLCFLHSFCMSQVSVFLLELTPFVSSVCRLCPNRYQHVLKAPYPSKMSVSTPYVEVRGNLHPK